MHLLACFPDRKNVCADNLPLCVQLFFCSNASGWSCGLSGDEQRDVLMSVVEIRMS